MMNDQLDQRLKLEDVVLKPLLVLYKLSERCV